ncbi:uncharacterized protein Z519_09248 [Cladophialophora bantiana CBS 173.52]|uniref:Ribosome maturation protein SDO1/SBDS N-terminal domain-containing protein n=1 Tax=Cladophialophora bantiana (strain ATCC 10958 / CBS 173.52 / CDC B-1940 / NIH 8579) TaxID=1442370 RepID=A0A0D2HYZ3_CLAB1|nr:uncharacterized protein Z519_09248 [Cladophialophora bantiana CBS 173.52]KIW89819.1 hypothetical protein Z519_09248 [Cladophialophora bantiana CBS 173.52]
MARGEAKQTRIYFKGKENEFVVFVDNPEAVEKWKADQTTPLVQVVKAFEIFVTHKHGNQGQLLVASNALLDEEFGTNDQEEIIRVILGNGLLQEKWDAERQGSRNDSIGPRGGH